MATDVESKTAISFSPELMEYIETWKDRPGNLIMILHKVQEEQGFISKDAGKKVAKILNVPLAKIYGVVTFYHYFRLAKPGKHNIKICMGTACYLKGGEDILSELENLLGIGVNQTTEDEHFSIEAVRCVGACGLAPVIVVDDEVYGKLTKDRLPEILAKYQEK